MLLIIVSCGKDSKGKYSNDETYTFDNCIHLETKIDGWISPSSSPLQQYKYYKNTQWADSEITFLKDKHSLTVNVQEKLIKIDGEVLPEEWIEQTSGYMGQSVDGYVMRYTNPDSYSVTRTKRIPDEDDFLFMDEIVIALYDSGRAVLAYEFVGRGIEVTNEVMLEKKWFNGKRDITKRKETAVEKNIDHKFLCRESEE